MKIQSRRRILLFQWGGKAYETRLEGIQEDSFVVEVKYWDKTMCINLGEPGGPDYVYDGILRPTLWMHKVSGGEELLTLLADSYYNKGEG